MDASGVAAWGALLLIPINAAAGWILRRMRSGKFRIRIRPHLILGYAALTLALVHTLLSFGDIGAVSAAGIWFAAFAVGLLGLQTFLGVSLQSPGVYRIPLRTWHVIAFLAIAIAAVAHVLMDAPFLAGNFP